MRFFIYVAIPLLIVIAISIYLTTKWMPLFISDKNSLYISFYASLIEDLVLFCVLGVFLIIFQVTKKDPSKAKISKRIQYLFGGKVLGERAEEHLRMELKKLSGYRKMANTDVTISEYNQSLKAFRITVERSFIVQNLFSDAKHEDTLNLKAWPDKLGVQVKHGCLTEMSLTSNNKSIPHELSLPMDIPPEGLTIPLSVNIPADGTGKYAFSYWIWNKDNIPFELDTTRFTEKFGVTFKNCAAIPINLTIGGINHRIPDSTARRIITSETDVLAGKKFAYGIVPA